MKRFKEGRQGTGYKTLTLFSVKVPVKIKLLGFDGHIIHYPDGSNIKPHKDTVQEGKHYRINLVLKRPERGGKFGCEGKFINIGNRLFVFRPDIQEHFVSSCIGSRIVLSIGWVIR